MSWARLSLLVNVTRDPTGIVTDFGDTPLEVMVIVAAIVPPVLDGDEGESLPPQAESVSARAAAARGSEGSRLNIKRTFVKY